MHASSICAGATTTACFALLRMPAQARAQPTVSRKGGKICPLFRACSDRAATGRPAASEKGEKFSPFTAGTEVRPHSHFALSPENKDNLSLFYGGSRSAPPHCGKTYHRNSPSNRCISCAMVATRKGGQFDLLFGAPCDRAAAERYNGSVCCAAAYALSCPLRSLRLCCSRVLTPRSQSSITDVS